MTLSAHTRAEGLPRGKARSHSRFVRFLRIALPLPAYNKTWE